MASPHHLSSISSSTILLTISIFILGYSINNLQQTSLVSADDDSPSPFHRFSLSTSDLGDHEIDSDGFTIDEHLGDIIDEEELGKRHGEHEIDHKPIDRSQHPFERTCPLSFFTCNNGECISPKWRCDGHYDCDDFSDEANCHTDSSIRPRPSLLDLTRSASTARSTTTSSTTTTPRPTNPNRHDDSDELHFNDTHEPLMLFSTGLSIRGYWMSSRILFDVATVGIRKSRVEQPSTAHAIEMFLDMLSIEPTATTNSDVVTLKSRSTIVGIDMDPVNKEVYWVELGKDAGVFTTILDGEQFDLRQRRQSIPNRYDALVDSGLLSPEDVALDLVGKNIYITDAGLPAIVVCSITHVSYCRILVKDNIFKPRAVIVDSTTGWLTYTDWGEKPGIYLVSMDGKKRETLLDTGVYWPNALATDYASNQLYWADAHLNKIERVDLKTKERHQVVKEVASNPFSLSLFENRIYWSDWSGSDIRTCDKIYGNNTKTIMTTENIYGIHIYHPSINRKTLQQVDPCWSKHCSHMCLLSPVSSEFANRKEGSITASCACPESMALSIGDKATCYEAELSFVLINVKDYIAEMFPERIGLHVIERVVHSKNHSIHDITTDWLHYRLFFFDAAQKQLYSVDLSNKRIKVEPFMQVSHSIKGLTYDVMSDNLFWLDTEKGTMSMCPVRGKFDIQLRRGLDKPTSLVLDSKNRALYISLAGKSPKIFRADILGHEEMDVTIVDSDITTPVAMQLDDMQQKLYWADSTHETIESIDLDINSFGTGVKPNSRVIYRRSMGKVMAFAVYRDSLLWTIKKSDYLFKSKLVGDHVHLASDRQQQHQQHEEPHPLSYRLPASSSDLVTSSDENAKIILVEPRYDASGIACKAKDCKYGCVLDVKNSASCICPDSNNLELCEDVERRLAGDTSMVWLILLLLLLSVTGLITLASLLTLYKQGRIPRQVSEFSVSFISPNRNKDGAMLLLDTDG